MLSSKLQLVRYHMFCCLLIIYIVVTVLDELIDINLGARLHLCRCTRIVHPVYIH